MAASVTSENTDKPVCLVRLAGHYVWAKERLRWCFWRIGDDAWAWRLWRGGELRWWQRRTIATGMTETLHDAECSIDDELAKRPTA